MARNPLAELGASLLEHGSCAEPPCANMGRLSGTGSISSRTGGWISGKRFLSRKELRPPLASNSHRIRADRTTRRSGRRVARSQTMGRDWYDWATTAPACLVMFLAVVPSGGGTIEDPHAMGDGKRSGRGPVAEFLVGVAAKTARFHRTFFHLLVWLEREASSSRICECAERIVDAHVCPLADALYSSLSSSR